MTRPVRPVARVDLAVLLYVAVEPVGDLLPSVAGMSTVRLVGAALIASWVARCVLDRRPVPLRHPVVVAAGALLLVLVASMTWHPNGAPGLQTAGRYVSYLLVLLILIDTMRHHVDPWRVARVFVWSCTAASLLALEAFARDGGRAAGPQQDPNDLAFFLVAAVPFALAAAVGRGRDRVLYGLAVVVLLVGVAATFSRGAALGLAAGALVALALGLVRPRHVAAGGVAATLAVVAVWTSIPQVVDRSIVEKQTVAQSNVDSRYASWRMAAEMTADHPVLGTGPAGFRTHFAAYEGRTTTDPRHLDVAHQMLLDVSSELGLLGLAAFLAVLAGGVTAAWRAVRASGDPGVDAAARRRLAAAVLSAFTATFVAALFLSEQYYLPVWLVVALGAAIDPRWAEQPRRASCVSSS